MTLDYHKVWNSLNELEMVTSKIVSAREILDSAIDRLQEHQYDKAETLLYAVDEFLQYYLEDFDRKFKDAWKETVVKLKEEEDMPPWGHSDIIRQYTDEELDAMCDNAAKQDKVVKWQLPVEEVENGDTGEQEYFITFPEDLLEAANLKVDDIVTWIDNGDGTYTLKHKTMSDTITPHDPYKDEMIAAGYKMVDGVWTMEKKPLNHDEMIEAGYIMTADGFWIKE
jgi:hypothetical protein